MKEESEYLVDGEENNYSADMPNRLGGRKNQESIYSSTMGYGVGEGNINANVITYALKSRTPSYTGDSDAYVALFYFKLYNFEFARILNNFAVMYIPLSSASTY